MAEILQEKLSNVGNRAVCKVPPKREYTRFCGLFFKKKAPAVHNRIIMIGVVSWLQHLARETNDEQVLRPALCIADYFIRGHLDSQGEEILFGELETLIKDYKVKFNQSELNALIEFSKEEHHIKIPKIIDEYLQNSPSAEPSESKENSCG